MNHMILINVTRNVLERTDFLSVWGFLQYTEHMLTQITSVIIHGSRVMMVMQMIIHKQEFLSYLLLCIIKRLHSVNINTSSNTFLFTEST